MTETTREDAFPSRPKGASAEHRIEVDASADAVWPVLADVVHWGRWNPIYPEASGELVVGKMIALTIAIPGMKSQKSAAKVLHVVPGRALQFGAPAFLGLLYATRYIEIHALGPNRCMVVNGEAFRRLLGPTLVRKLGAKIEDGLRQQNEGLKGAAMATPSA